MFSQGQIIFSVAFIIVFIIVIAFMYRKDLKMHKTYYKGSLWVLFGLLTFIAILYVIKITLKE